jgi:hypothetical protein
MHSSLLLPYKAQQFFLDLLSSQFLFRIQLALSELLEASLSLSEQVRTIALESTGAS